MYGLHAALCLKAFVTSSFSIVPLIDTSLLTLEKQRPAS